MALAHSRSELAGLVRALMERLDMADDELLSSCVDTLAAGIRPSHGPSPDLDLVSVARLVRAKFPPSCLIRQNMRAPEQTGHHQVAHPAHALSGPS